MSNINDLEPIYYPKMPPTKMSSKNENESRCIDAKKIIETIDNSSDLGGVLGTVVDCVKLYAKYMIATAPTANMWTPCEDALPEAEEKTYWICTDTEYQCQCRWTNANHFWTDITTNWHWNIFDYPQYSKVVAWMPLPEPWKGKEECKNIEL